MSRRLEVSQESRPAENGKKSLSVNKGAPDGTEIPGNVPHKKPVAYRFLKQSEQSEQHEQREPLWTRTWGNGPGDRDTTDPWTRNRDGGPRYRVVIARDDPDDDVRQLSENPEERTGAPPRTEKQPDTRKKEEYWKDCVEDWKQLGTYATFQKNVEPYLPAKPKPPKRRAGSVNQDDCTSSDSKDPESEQDDLDQDIELPSWVSRISGASFALFRLPGMNKGGRIGRQNADPLVGSPQEGHKNYSAAQDTKVDLRSDRRLRFRKRPGSRQDPAPGHCSLYTEGFILTEVDTVAEPARLGGIPKTWTQIAGWNDAVDGEGGPPAEFWRTLVADRGKDNRNPPYYYATACKESVRKGGLQGGSVDTGALISSERNSIIAEFCRRVQAVIWNRRLIRTRGPSKILGLAGENVQKGDHVCIISGCTVPVILRQHKKVEGDLEKERMQDSIESMKTALSICEEACFRKVRYRKRLMMERERGPEMEELWKQEVQAEMQAVNKQMREWRDQEKLAVTEKQRRDEEQKTRKNDAERRSKNARAKRRKAENAGKTHKPGRSETMPVTGSGPMTGHQTTLDDDDDDEDAPEAKSKEQEEKEEEERKRQEMKDKAREEDPKKWYKFIGEAYIHGMMDGEAVRVQFMDGIPMRMFEIR